MIPPMRPASDPDLYLISLRYALEAGLENPEATIPETRPALLLYNVPMPEFLDDLMRRRHR